MLAWWNGMDLTGQVYALVAIPSTLILVVQTVLLLFGIGGDDVEADGLDLSGNGIGDTPGDGGGDGLALFSVRGLMAMAAVGGWSGLVMHEAGLPLPVTIFLSVVCGFLALAGVAYLMKATAHLQGSGNIDLDNAIGQTGTVYLAIPAQMQGSGKINITVQERFLEVGAVTHGRRILTGESVRVMAKDGTGLVVVEPLEAAAPPEKT